MRLACLLVVLAGCGHSAYECTAAVQCVAGGEHGVCEPEGYCSFADSSCPAGRKFEPNAGNGLAGTCVMLTPDANPDSSSGPSLAFVQQTAADFGAVASGTVTFPNSVGVHHALVVTVDIQVFTSTVAVSDSQGNHYTPVVGPYGDASNKLVIYAAFDVAGGPDTLTFTLSEAATSNFEVYLHEYTGITAFDVGVGGVGTNVAVDGIVSGRVRTTAPDELLFGYANCGTCTSGTGFDLRSNFHGNVTEDLIVNATGDYQMTASVVGGSNWQMVMATFR